MVLLYSATVFLSAFLLFQVQPIIGRFILPWFGSAPGVWATCLLFFQAILLLGYSYAHFVVNRWSPRRQALVHVVLLTLAALTLPITPDDAWKPLDADDPIWHILGILSLSVGIPYLILTTTGPLLQGWFAKLSTASPYRLYALSNFGSLLALLSYPVWVEPNVTLSGQTLVWSVGFVLFAALCAGCAWFLARHARTMSASTVTSSGESSPPGIREMLHWVALATCGSALLLATTNQLSLDVAVVPFLWVVPLALYLLSFVFCFDHDRWYVRPLYCLLLLVGVINAVRLIEGGIHLDIRDQILGYSAVMFFGCMCLHGEMARRRPAPQHLTLFYLMLAIGGVLGGLLVAVVAPAVFSGFYEYPVALVATCALVAWSVLGDRFPRPRVTGPKWRNRLEHSVWAACLLVILAGIVLTVTPGDWIGSGIANTNDKAFDWWLATVRIAAGLTAIASVAIAMTIARLRPATVPASQTRQLAPRLGVVAIASSGVVALAGALFWLPQPEEQLHLVRDRNFYGVLAIKNYDYGDYPRIGLKHGRIRHGIQLLEHPDWPTSYYGPASGVGTAILHHPERETQGRGFRVGVVGLGAGTLAVYMNASFNPTHRGDYARVESRNPPDTIRFYELNPMVANWAEEKFTFLLDARRRGASVDTLLGDARIVLERQLREGDSQRFDVLVVDAFTGDAIPIHLLTRESLEIYLSHLAEGGILAFHVSNLYIDVKPVIHRLAQELELELVYSKNRDNDLRGVDSSSWMLLTRNQDFLAKRHVRRFERNPPDAGPLWTDDYSSVFSLLRFD